MTDRIKEGIGYSEPAGAGYAEYNEWLSRCRVRRVEIGSSGEVGMGSEKEYHDVRLEHVTGRRSAKEGVPLTREL